MYLVKTSRRVSLGPLLTLSQCLLRRCTIYTKSNVCDTTVLPQQTKIIDKWRRYWNDLIKDYMDVLKETAEDCKKSPRKSLLLGSLFGFTIACFKTNPDYINYRDNIVSSSNNVLLVAKPVRNPDIDEFLTSIENCYNLGVLRRLSFGIFSVMWIDNFSSDLGVFKSRCSYLKPQYVTFYNRIVDIGFLGKWWRLGRLMQDYDINAEEWIKAPKENL